MSEPQNTEQRPIGPTAKDEPAELAAAPDGDLVETTPVAPTQRQSRARLSPGALFFGVLVCLGFVAFILLAKVTVHYQDALGDRVSRNMRVLDVWQRLRNDLPDVAHPTLLRVAFDISITLVIAGSLVCVWLALMAASPKEHGDQQDRRDSPSASAEPQLLKSEH
jgi:hypothetical protein